MSEPPMLEKYIEYIDILKKRLDVYFSEQKPFLKCKAGCEYCCTASYYPTSELEYQYVRIGIQKCFTEEAREKINESVLDIIKQRRLYAQNNENVWKFTYRCPLLVNGACGIYEYRPLLCRSHGLLFQDISKPKVNLPICINKNLNYADIFDHETQQFSEEKFNAGNYQAKPKVYDLSYSSLMKAAGGLAFGEVMMLFEWIVTDIPDYEKVLETL